MNQSSWEFGYTYTLVLQHQSVSYCSKEKLILCLFFFVFLWKFSNRKWGEIEKSSFTNRGQGKVYCRKSVGSMRRSSAVEPIKSRSPTNSQSKLPEKKGKRNWHKKLILLCTTESREQCVVMQLPEPEKNLVVSLVSKNTPKALQ